jgi:O-antigen/teichoic acid export membrane protein
LLRPVIVAFIDQALLSALSFALAIALIRHAPAAEYGLYSQLLNLQSLFSVVHAGVFVSGFLAVHASLPAARRIDFVRYMARRDALFGLTGTIVVAALTLIGAALLRSPVSPATAVASSLAVLGLWWREFVRAGHFAELRADRVLRLDVGYVALAAFALALLAAWQPLSAGTVLAATGVAGIVVGGLAVARLAWSAGGGRDAPSWYGAWHHGQWDAYGSVITWLQSQSYVYFAAAAGGLALAGTVSAARLVGMPLALAWAGSASLVRVAVSNALAAADPGRVRRLVRRALVAVVVISAAYATVVAALLPVVDRFFYQGKFAGIGVHVGWWLAYFTLTGVSSLSAAILRGALRMAALFRYYLLACAVTVPVLAAMAFWRPQLSLVVGLIAGEVVLCALAWAEVRKLNHAPASAGATGDRGASGDRVHVPS